MKLISKSQKYKIMNCGLFGILPNPPNYDGHIGRGKKLIPTQLVLQQPARYYEGYNKRNCGPHRCHIYVCSIYFLGEVPPTSIASHVFLLHILSTWNYFVLYHRRRRRIMSSTSIPASSEQNEINPSMDNFFFFFREL
jgi:hypothetical protein